MIKHEVVCDKCGKQEQLVYNYEIKANVDLPEKWESVGICPVSIYAEIAHTV